MKKQIAIVGLGYGKKHALRCMQETCEGGDDLIFDSIKNMDCYQNHEEILKALRLASETAEDSVFPLTYDDGRIRIDRLRYQTKASGETYFEAHRKFADIHITLEGEEGIAYADVKRLKPVEAFSEAEDIGFYDGEKDGICFARPGTFMVCFPQDAHKPCISVRGEETVAKLIVKVLYDKEEMD